ncbi:MAG: CotH kinase family protein [Rikenellaceae bacterium]|nr:CotH kinase family protein [Rikenellaceae bacterium]
MSASAMDVELSANIEAPEFHAPQLAIDAPQTRTIVIESLETEEGVATWWAKREVIGVYGNLARNAKFTSTNTKSAQNVSFSGLMLGTPKYAYYPYNSANSNASASAVKQTMSANHSFNSTSKVLQDDFYAGVLNKQGWLSSTFTFDRLVSVWKIQVNASDTKLENERLESVTIQVNNQRQITGDFTIDLATQQVTMGGYSDGDNQLKVSWDATPYLKKGVSYAAYTTAMPEIRSGDELTFTVKTTNSTATFTKVASADHTANGFYIFPLTLSAMDDIVIEEENPEEEAPMPTSTYEIKSMKFTVANNPGKILPRKFTHNSSFALTTSNVTEEVCTIDQENRIIKLYVPYLNDRYLVPTFELTEGAVLLYQGGMAVSNETEMEFSNNEMVAAANVETGEITVYTIEFTNTGLPVVVINQKTGVVTSESGDYSRGSAAWYKATGAAWQPKDSDWQMTEGTDSFMVYNADGSPALVDKDGRRVYFPIPASTRVRGNVTQQMPKKPFAVKLDKKHSVLGMPAHKRWVLLANWKDRTLMRNSVAFELAKIFKSTFPNDGMSWNPSGQFVELVYNGVYVGNYYLCEQIKIDSNRLDINDPMEDSDSTSPADYGILMESDDGYDEAAQFTTACYVPFLLKDDASTEVLNYASSFVRGIEDNLYKNTKAGYNAAFEKMDLSSFIDFWLVQEIMMNSEVHHPKSCYSYINNGKLYAGPVWDFDWNTLPTSTSYSEEGYRYNRSMLMTKDVKHSSSYPSKPSTSDANYIWYPMLVKNADFTAMAAERWNTVKASLQARILTHIDQMKAQLAKSAAENSAMWPVDSKSGWIGARYSTYGIGGGYCGDEGMTFENAVNQLKTTISTRIEGMSYVSNKNWE